MFSFPTTRMTAAARSAPLPAYADSPARQSLVYCLVFLIAILSQSILQIPFVIWHLIATDALQNLASLDTAAISDAIAQAMHHLMPARLYTTLGTIAVCLIYCRRVEKRSFFSMGITSYVECNHYNPPVTFCQSGSKKTSPEGLVFFMGEITSYASC